MRAQRWQQVGLSAKKTPQIGPEVHRKAELSSSFMQLPFRVLPGVGVGIDSVSEKIPMSDTTPKEPRVVELIFEDEGSTFENEGSTHPRFGAQPQAPRFRQSASARPEHVERPAHLDPFATTGDEDGAYSYSSARFKRVPKNFTPFAWASRFTHEHSDRVSSALVQGRFPVSVLAGVIFALAVVGIFASNVSGSAAIPAVTSPLAGAGGVLAAVATLVRIVFSPLGALILVALAWAVLRRRGEKATASAMLLAMWSAWMVTGLVSIVALGAVPFIVSPIAFLGAAATLSITVAVSSSRSWAWEVGLLASVLAVGVSAFLIAAGGATLLGAASSLILGAIGANLGVRVWNRWWAPLFDARTMLRRMSSMWRTRAA